MAVFASILPMLMGVVAGKDGHKSRIFEAGLLLGVHLRDDRSHPLLSMFCARPSALRPFMANVRLGCTVTYEGGHYDFRKNDFWDVSYQTFPEGSVATIYRGDLLRIEPMSDALTFCMMVPDWYMQQQVHDLGPDFFKALYERLMGTFNFSSLYGSYKLKEFEDFPKFVVYGLLFQSYLDRRVSAPLLNDPIFSLQLLLAAYTNDMLWDTGVLGGGVAKIGQMSDRTYALFFKSTLKDVHEVIAKETSRYFEGHYGTT